MTDTLDETEEDQTVIDFAVDADHLRVKTELGHIVRGVGEWLLGNNQMTVSDIDHLVETLTLSSMALNLFAHGIQDEETKEEPNG